VDEPKDTEVARRHPILYSIQNPDELALIARALPFNEIALPWIFGIVDSINLIRPTTFSCIQFSAVFDCGSTNTVQAKGLLGKPSQMTIPAVLLVRLEYGSGKGIQPPIRVTARVHEIWGLPCLPLHAIQGLNSEKSRI
jgi:hypothetical protein